MGTRLHLPLHQRTYRYLRDKEDTTLYAACQDLPEVSGGRYFSTVSKHLLTRDTLKSFSEELGPRFDLTANSLLPEWTSKFEQTLEILAQNKSSLTIASPEFALRVSEEFPELTIHASCISFFEWEKERILDSPIFSGVCGPQFWNYDIDRMAEEIPEEIRSRVFYILNSDCLWTPGCREHYLQMSLSYHDQHDRDWSAGHDLPLQLEDDFALATRTLSVFEGLKDQGFSWFKLQGRERDPFNPLFLYSVLIRDLDVLPVRDFYKRFESSL